MLALDAYRPDQWHDFFATVGGSAAVLSGLVFVALSLNLGVIARDATHRYRAIDTLAGMIGVFVLCALVLMGGALWVSFRLREVAAREAAEREAAERERLPEPDSPA